MRVNLLSPEMADHAEVRVHRIRRREGALRYYRRNASNPAFRQLINDRQNERRKNISDEEVERAERYAREYRKTDKAKASNRLYMKAFREQRRVHVDAIKARPCMDCSGTFHPCAMHFDHRPGTAKFFNIGEALCRYPLEVLDAEIAKCDVVCANCHAVRTHVGRR